MIKIDNNTYINLEAIAYIEKRTYANNEGVIYTLVWPHTYNYHLTKKQFKALHLPDNVVKFGKYHINLNVVASTRKFNSGIYVFFDAWQANHFHSITLKDKAAKKLLRHFND